MQKQLYVFVYLPLVMGFLTITITNANCHERKLIIDVDAGVDDFQALVALLNGEAQGKVKIIAIICSDGNTARRNCERNVLRLLQIVQRTDIPVYPGSYHSLMPRENIENFYGLDGFGDLKLKENLSLNLIKKEIAPSAIANFLNKYKGKISYMALGPLTNLALTIRMYDDVADNLKEVYIMGGNYGEKKVEFNFLGDPDAANIVLSSIRCPITLLPFQACDIPGMSFGWRFNCTLNPNPVWNLIERAERKLFGYIKHSKQYISCDPILAQVFLHENVIVEKFSKHNAMVDLCGKNKALLTIQSSGENDKIRIIEKVVPNIVMNNTIKEYSDICYNYVCKKIYD